MRVTNQQNTLSLSELRNHLESKRGILLWITLSDESCYRILKTSDNSYKWVNLFVDKTYDISLMRSLDQLLDSISKTDGEFHWFNSEQECIEWLRSTHKIISCKTCPYYDNSTDPICRHPQLKYRPSLLPQNQVPKWCPFKGENY